VKLAAPRVGHEPPAMGRYEGARVVLGDGGFVRVVGRACVFDGMAAVMLHDYRPAVASLSRVKRGREDGPPSPWRSGRRVGQ
jgi:hypothetical protein